jgi:hypothetical protein
MAVINSTSAVTGDLGATPSGATPPIYVRFGPHRRKPDLARDLLLQVQQIRSGASVTAELYTTNDVEEQIQAMFAEVEELLALELIH